MRAAGRHTIAYTTKSATFKIWNIADVHLMNKAAAIDQVEADIKTIQNDPYSFWLGGGDYADYISYRDRRFDPDSVAPDVKIEELGALFSAGIKRIAKMFSPIKHKCLGLLLGNHELTYARRSEQDDKHAWLCEELGVRNLGYCTLFDVVFTQCTGYKVPKLNPFGDKTPPGRIRTGSRWPIRVFAHHGAGYAQTPGGKLNRLIQFMHTFNADVYFCGHVHDQLGKRIGSISADTTCTRITDSERIGVISGSYLKTYKQNCTGYGEVKGYAPTTLGSAVVYITPAERKLRALV